MTLEQFFAENREVAIAFSGGVDSAYLLYPAKKYAAKGNTAAEKLSDIFKK